MRNFINKISKWVGTDGLLHFLVCYALMLTLTPVIGIWWTILATAIVTLSKEAWDYFYQKDNDKNAVLHDIICDACGIILAVLTMLVWWACNG